jgi:two-component system, NarL family, response regulator NreC
MKKRIPMKKHKLLIVDDHGVVIEGIKSLLVGSNDFEVIGEATNGLEGVDKALSLQPDIVIMDLSMSGMNGLEASKLIKDKLPQIHVVVYTMHSDDATVLELFRLGISAYVLKDGPISDLLMALEAVKRDATFFRTVAPRSVMDHLQKKGPAQNDLGRLSPREKEVLELLVEGKVVKEIAERLCLSRKTIETHKYHMMEKLKINNLADLIRFVMSCNAQHMSIKEGTEHL